jgi:hypothetical protein
MVESAPIVRGDLLMTDAIGVAQRALTRRTVVRAGAHAAWAVPAITVATAAPALAVSGGAVLNSASFQVTYSKSKLHVRIGPIKNSGATATTGPVTVIFSAPKMAQTSMSNPYDNGVQNNWTYVGKSSSASSDDYTFVSKQSSLKPNQSTGMLGFKLNTTSSKPAGQFTYSATAPGSTGTAGTTTAKSAQAS